MPLLLTLLTLLQPAPAWDARLRQTDGWIGADGAYSVALTPQRTIWLYSDTWVGKVRDGKRTDATIVNNTLAVQDGLDPATAKVEFIIRRNASGKPEAFIEPEDGRGWYWLHAGVLVHDRLVLFLLQIEKTGDPGVFGFRQIGEWLAIVDNPRDPPLQWRIRQKKLPFATFTEKRQVAFGTAALVHGDELFVYGTLVTIEGKTRDSSLVLAKVATKDLDDFTAWWFFAQNAWHKDATNLQPLIPRMAAEGSVHHDAATKRFVLIYTDQGLSPRILRRTAPAPTGPWSEPEVVYTCPEIARDKKLFTYAAKAHPHLSAPGKLLITYAVNSLDFWQVAQDATLYWPQFVEVPSAR